MLVDIHTHHPSDGAVTISTTGVHPWDAEDADLISIERAAADAEAIGEIGLDGVCRVDMKVQEQVFTAQLRLAEQLKKPVVLHCVKCFERAMQLLAEYRLQAVIFHGFIGSVEQASKAINRGYCLSFGERVFRSPKSIEAMRRTPLDRLFFETDDAEVSIAEIYRKASEIIGIEVAGLEMITNENYNRIFGKI